MNPFIPKSATTFEKKNAYMPDDSPVPAPTTDRVASTKCCPQYSLDARSTVPNPSGPDPTKNPTIPSTVTRNTSTPVDENIIPDQTYYLLVVFSAYLE